MSNKYSSGRTNWLRYSALLLVAFLFSQGVWAQVSAYTFSQSSGTYAPLASPTVLATATAASGATTSMDSQNFTVAFPGGFSFVFNGTAYSSAVMNSNGFITFGATAPAASLTTPISSTTAFNGAVAAWAGDLNAIYELNSSTFGQMNYELVGTSPNQEMVFEWKNFRPAYSSSTTSEYAFSFQIRLQENGSINVMYGGTLGFIIGSTGQSGTRQIGLRGATNADFNNRTNAAGANFTASTAGTGNSSTQAFNTSATPPGMPSSGLTYSWAAPACFAPTGLAVTSVTASSASFSWNAPVPAPSGYNWEVRTSGAAGSGATGLVASGSSASSPATATGLSANTTYTIYVQSDCGGSPSAWSAGVTAFTGYCASTSTASTSYITNFVTTGASGSNISNNSAGWSATGYGDFTAQSAQSYAGSSVGFTMNITGTTVGVGVWIDWNNDLDFADAGETMVLTTGYQSSPYTNSFSVPGGAALGSYRMRVRIDWNASSPAACGNISRGETEDYTFEVVAAPACIPPTALTATPGETSADLSWTAGGTETLWNLEYGPAGFTQGTGTAVLGHASTTYTIASGLTAGTSYQYYVLADCGGSTSTWAGPFTFNTLVAGDNCSNVIDLGTLTSPYSSTTAGAAADFSFACNGNASPDLIYSLLVPDGYTLVIGQTVNGYDSENYLFYGGACPGSTQIACYDDPDTQTNTWENTTGSDQTVYWVQDGYFDNTNFGTFTLEWSLTAPPTCPDPSAGVASNLTTTSADLGWTENGTATTWNVEYGVAGFTLGSGTLISGTTSNPVTASPLSSGTAYQFYVQSDCGGGDLSAWVGPFSFTTVCGSFSVPFNEGFEGLATVGAGLAPACNAFQNITGTAATSANAAVRNGVGARTGTKYFWSRWSSTNVYYTPAITLTNGQSYDFSYWNRETDGSTGFTVESYVGTTADWTAMSLLGTAASPAATAYTENRDSYVAPADGDYYFAIKITETSGGPWYQVIDDITVEETPACAAPSALTALNITATGAEFDWTAGGSETLWNIEIGPAGYTQGTGITISDINSLPYPVTGSLSANTAYDYYVQANCGGSTSAWAGPYSFTTSPGCGSSWQDPGGAGNYGSNLDVTTTVCPDTPGEVVTVTFTSFATESGWDFLDIYEGSSTSGTLIGSYTGTTSPGVITSTDPSGCLTFNFTSDGGGSAAGWDADFTCGPPPTCGTPSVSGLTPSYNTVSFTINASVVGTPSGFYYEIVPDGDTPTGTGTFSATGAITAPTTLTPSTPYDLYVQTDCGVSDGLSEWLGPISFTTNAAPPANDDCVNAISIDCASTGITGTTINSTVDANYVNAGAGGSNTTERGVWYVITPGVGENFEYTINTCATPGYDTRLTAFQGAPDCSSLIPLTGNDDMGSPCSAISTLRSEITFNAFEGNTYYVFVHGYQFGTALSNTGDFVLNISCAAACLPPANDACASAETLDQNTTCINTSGSTTCSTNTVGLNNPAGVSTFATYNDVWYSFTASYNDYYLTFSNITATNLLYSIFVGTDCASLNATGIDGFLATDGFEQGLFGATVGETYWIRVGIEPGTGADGTFDLCLVGIPCSTPVNSTVTATSQSNVEVVIGGVEGEAYIIEYGPAGFTPGTDGTAGAGGFVVNTTTLTNNIPVVGDTNYDFYIRKDCSGSAEGYSFNEGPYAVSTFLVVPFSGSNTLTLCDAVIYDHAGTSDYANNADGYLVLYPSTPGSVLRLQGSYQVESGWDYITIYEGVGTGGTVLGSFTGSGSFDITGGVLNGAVTVRFDSDTSGPDAGFEITTSCLPACSGVPSIGVLDGPATACSGVPFTMSVANPLVGYAYQWQKITGAGWTNIAGANSASYTATQTATTTYRCRVSCTLPGGWGAISAPKTVGMSNPTECYCSPTYTSGTGFEYVDNVSLGGINNSTGASSSPYYVDYGPGAGTTTTLAQGAEYTGSVSIIADSNDYIYVWIDFNRNGVFDASERVFLSSALAVDGPQSFNFVVPGNASLGTTKMRVRLVYNNGSADPCATYGFGETEDYTVTLVAGVANDAQANATAINQAPYPACVNYTANLANATPSTGGGNDVWYQFVASSNAARIAVTSAFDVSIEVRDAGDNVIDAVEDATAAGNETFITGGLTEGDTYWVIVRDESGAPSTCNVCIQALNPSTCDNGPVFSSLCNLFKADWTGTTYYNFTFVDQVDLTTHTGSTTNTSNLLLSTVAGLQHGHSYDVTIDAVYNLTNAAGVAEQVIATSTSSCPITILPAAAVNLRAIDRDPATRAIGSFIATDVYLCATVSWDWSFELVDDFGAPLGIEGPQIVNSGSSSRYFRTSNIPGVAAGNRYRVRIRPVFASGTGTFDDASFYYLRIAGGAGMVENEGNDATPNNFVVGEGSGASAAIYPNPSNGEMVNLNLAGINSDNVMVRIMDASGRLVWSNRYVVDGSLNTIVSFDRPLAAGLYIVEMNFDGEVLTERMMVQK